MWICNLCGLPPCPLSSASVSQGCVHLTSSEICPLGCRACVHLTPQFPQVYPLCTHVWGLCALVLLLGLASASQVKWTCFSSALHSLSGLIFFSFSAVAGELCTLLKFVCLPSNGTPVLTLHLLGLSVGYRLFRPTLHAAKAVHTGWGFCLPHHTWNLGQPLCCIQQWFGSMLCSLGSSSPLSVWDQRS